MIFNQKGDYILYLIITILAILIGAILYFVYTGGYDDSSSGNTLDSNFISEFKAKVPNKDILLSTEYTTQYPISASFDLDIKIEIDDKNVIIDGNPSIIISERSFKVNNPELTNFIGIIDSTGLDGGINTINGKDFDLDIRARANISFDLIDSIKIKDIELNLESSNISGQLNIQSKPHTLNKSYLQIKGFSGNLTIIPGQDHNSTKVELDGNVGYLKIIDGIEETVLK